MKRSLLLIPAFALALFACDKSEKYYISEDEAKAFDLVANPPVSHAAFIMTNDVFYAENLAKGSALKRLTNKPKDLKDDVRISPDHTKVSYIDANGAIVVINIADGKAQPPIKDYEGQLYYDWLPTSDGFYFLFPDSIKFNKKTLPYPNIVLGQNDKRQAIAFGNDGTFYFMVTENPGTVNVATKLYYWDKKKFYSLNYELAAEEPTKVRLNVATGGDLTVMVSRGITDAYDIFYVYPKDSVNFSYKKTIYDLYYAKYDSRLKQEVYFAEPEFGVFNNVWITNYNGYARSKDAILDSTFFTGFKAFPTEMDWKQ